MGFRFRKSIKVAPGVRMNIGKKGVSGVSVGKRGVSASIGRNGVYVNAGLPGTGVSHRAKLSGGNKASNRQSPLVDNLHEVPIELQLQVDGSVRFVTKDGDVLPEEIVREVKRIGKKEILNWLEANATDENETHAMLANIHFETPSPDKKLSYHRQPFTSMEKPSPVDELAYEPPPKPQEPTAKAWHKIFPRRAKHLQDNYAQELLSWEKICERKCSELEEAQRVYRSQIDKYNQKKSEFAKRENQVRHLIEEGRFANTDEMGEFLSLRFRRISWPRQTDLSFEILKDQTTAFVDVDLPEIEHLPTHEYVVKKRDLVLSKSLLSDKEIRRRYAHHIHAIVFRLIGETFTALPTIQLVAVSGYSQRVNKANGHIQDEYLLSVRVNRQAWSQLNFSGLSDINLFACFAQFDLRCSLNKLFRFSAINPFTLDDVGEEMSATYLPEVALVQDPTEFVLKGNTFLDHDGLRAVANLRRDGRFGEAEMILLDAEPTPAVLDELRKLLSSQAKLARKQNDWGAVQNYLERYLLFAEANREMCESMVNQSPPNLTNTEQKLLEKARLHQNIG